MKELLVALLGLTLVGTSSANAIIVYVDVEVQVLSFGDRQVTLRKNDKRLVVSRNMVTFRPETGAMQRVRMPHAQCLKLADSKACSTALSKVD